MRFDARVPAGKPATFALSHDDSAQRSHAPSAAPMPTAAMCASIGSTYELLDVRGAETDVDIVPAAHVDLAPHVLVADLPTAFVEVDHRTQDVEERDHLRAVV